MEQMQFEFEPQVKERKKRAYRDTSEAAYEAIKESRQSIHKKIEEALRRIKIGGTYHEVALASGLTDAQVWKRFSEMENVYDTKIRRELPSGKMGIVWQIKDI